MLCVLLIAWVYHEGVTREGPDRLWLKISDGGSALGPASWHGLGRIPHELEGLWSGHAEGVD